MQMMLVLREVLAVEAVELIQVLLNRVDLVGLVLFLDLQIHFQ
jgi:hypothetical protein